ncbi:MAG TPA: ECF-type sigma factor [Terriglobia bacterium]|nr:ECF-type sigma factor [Terriglobia bacterium]
MDADRSAVTAWLHRFRDGDPEAARVLLEILYRELHRIAQNYMRHERANHTLQPTALIHEAYLRLVEQQDRDWQNRSHFLAAAAQAMRRILIDSARARMSKKRGGDAVFVELGEHADGKFRTPEAFMALTGALDELRELDPELAHLVDLRFFGGLTEEEVAEVCGVNVRSVKRRWSTAKAWLRSRLVSG